ncbi:hypothetical protein LPJ59_001948 [Coemansia sp. RSA 2399]|nr:hypothetical protein LPJ59_001948 [Coemansia sp. RSA 2399]
MACECESHHHAPLVPPACWFLVHDRKEPCGCGGDSCEKYNKLMAKLVLCGFDPMVKEDVIFLRNIVVNESGDGDKTCETLDASSSGSEWDNDWHLASLFIVVGASALGVFLPIISQTVRGFGHHVVVPSFALQAGQFFGAGVIVATAFIHLFPAATDALTNPCLGAFADKYGAWASLFAMAAVFTMHSVEWWLIEAWVSRADYSRSEADEAESAVGGIYPRYSNAFNASRLTGMLPLPPPMLSPPVNPLVFGASTRSLSMRTNHNAGYAQQPSTYNSARTGFALTRHGNYATLARSKYQLALLGACGASTDRVARYLRSEPQFPLCAPSIAPTHRSNRRPHYHPRGILVRGSIQAKSTPELMPKSTTIGARMLQQQQQQQQHSTVSSGKNNTASSKGISLRPNSFTRRSIKRISGGSSKRSRHRMSAGVYRVSGAAAGNGWRHRCLSMPRLPPTTLDAGMCESLLDQQQQQQQQTSYHLVVSPVTQSTSSSSRKRRSSIMSPPRRLDPVPEDARPAQIAASDDDDDDYAGSVAPVFTTATMHMHPHKSPTYSMYGSTKPKRVSIPTPPTAAPSSCVYQSMGAGLVRQKPPMYLNSAARSADPSQSAAAAAAAPGFDSDSAAESTAIHSSKEDGGESLANRRLYPVEVQRRALATYVLELGIALYSVLVGLALATTSMHGFFALLVAVCFHQFFEGLALGTSLSELYWVKAQLEYEMQMEQNEASRGSGAREQPQCIDEEEEEEEQGPDAHTCSDDFEYVSVDPIGIQARAKSKSRRTLASMATSFTPEPWQVNPNIEQNIDDAKEPAADERPRYLQHRAGPDRFPGWWKAWLSAMFFTATTPTGIVIGLALRSIYEPQSRYALLLNGILQSICTGILVYAGLVTLLVGGFSSFQVKQLPRHMQLVLFLAVYAGAAVMAAVKIWT